MLPNTTHEGMGGPLRAQDVSLDIPSQPEASRSWGPMVQGKAPSEAHWWCRGSQLRVHRDKAQAFHGPWALKSGFQGSMTGGKILTLSARSTALAKLRHEQVIDAY